jgi:hypothetical protein
MQLMEIYLGTNFQVSKTPQVNIKRFKNALSALVSVSPQQTVFFNKARTLAEESDTSPMKSGRPVMRKFASELLCLETPLQYS